MDFCEKIEYTEINKGIILKWKCLENGIVNGNNILFEYKTDKIKKYKTRCNGTLKKILIQEGQTVNFGDIVCHVESCKHATVWRNMCAECGADLREDKNVSNLIAMEHSIPDLLVNERSAQILGKEESDRLIKQKKLVLLVDLDQTLIHTTNENVPVNLKGVHHFQLSHGGQQYWYHTCIRPHTKEFLENISQLYELHICTFGARAYAHKIAAILDPDKKYFQNRILSRDECFHPTLKTLNLKALFPCGDSMVCIIDDREDVWRNAPNLVRVKPYKFFNNTDDINAPIFNNNNLTNKNDDNKSSPIDYKNRFSNTEDETTELNYNKRYKRNKNKNVNISEQINKNNINKLTNKNEIDVNTIDSFSNNNKKSVIPNDNIISLHSINNNNTDLSVINNNNKDIFSISDNTLLSKDSKILAEKVTVKNNIYEYDNKNSLDEFPPKTNSNLIKENTNDAINKINLCNSEVSIKEANLSNELFSNNSCKSLDKNKTDLLNNSNDLLNMHIPSGEKINNTKIICYKKNVIEDCNENIIENLNELEKSEEKVVFILGGEETIDYENNLIPSNSTETLTITSNAMEINFSEPNFISYENEELLSKENVGLNNIDQNIMNLANKDSINLNNINKIETINNGVHFKTDFIDEKISIASNNCKKLINFTKEDSSNTIINLNENNINFLSGNDLNISSSDDDSECNDDTINSKRVDNSSSKLDLGESNPDLTKSQQESILSEEFFNFNQVDKNISNLKLPFTEVNILHSFIDTISSKNCINLNKVENSKLDFLDDEGDIIESKQNINLSSKSKRDVKLSNSNLSNSLIVDTTGNELIEWKDDDDYLKHLEDILTRIHLAFYKIYDQFTRSFKSNDNDSTKIVANENNSSMKNEIESKRSNSHFNNKLDDSEFTQNSTKLIFNKKLIDSSFNSKLIESNFKSTTLNTACDIKNIVPYVRKKVLKNCNILFSGLIPVNQPIKNSWAYGLAESLGAKVHERLKLKSHRFLKDGLNYLNKTNSKDKIKKVSELKNNVKNKNIVDLISCKKLINIKNSNELNDINSSYNNCNYNSTNNIENLKNNLSNNKNNTININSIIDSENTILKASLDQISKKDYNKSYDSLGKLTDLSDNSTNECKLINEPELSNNSLQKLISEFDQSNKLIRNLSNASMGFAKPFNNLNNSFDKSTAYIEYTTHLVAAKLDTEKVKQVQKFAPNVKIVNPDWLVQCSERWEWVEEALFALNENWGGVGRNIFESGFIETMDINCLKQPISFTTSIQPKELFINSKKRTFIQEDCNDKNVKKSQLIENLPVIVHTDGPLVKDPKYYKNVSSYEIESKLIKIDELNELSIGAQSDNIIPETLTELERDNMMSEVDQDLSDDSEDGQSTNNDINDFDNFEKDEENMEICDYADRDEIKIRLENEDELIAGFNSELKTECNELKTGSESSYSEEKNSDESDDEFLLEFEKRINEELINDSKNK